MTLTTTASTARVPTASASKYLQQVCKHWQHNLAVEFTPEHGTIVFPKDARGANHPGDAMVTFDAGSDTLDVHIAASSAEQLEGLKGAVARPRDRVAVRAAPRAGGCGRGAAASPCSSTTRTTAPSATRRRSPPSISRPTTACSRSARR